MCVKAGYTVRSTDRTSGAAKVETVAEVVNVYGATVRTKEGNVYFLGEYVVVDKGGNES